jgi:hypothetical protein
MPTGPPDEKYFENFPAVGEERERLAAYQTQRIIDEAAVTVERKLVAEALFRRDLGHELTQAEQNIIAYSPYGSGSSCGY